MHIRLMLELGLRLPVLLMRALGRCFGEGN